MKKRLMQLALTTVLIMFLTYCKVNIGTMIDDYNTNFIEDTTERDKITTFPSPGDDDFSEDKMLDDEYFVWSDATINLCAPDNCAEYSWIFTDPDDKEETPIPVHYFGTNEFDCLDSWTYRNLTINIQDSGLTSNKVYILTLQVVSKEGSSYKDKAAIVVYQHLII